MISHCIQLFSHSKPHGWPWNTLSAATVQPAKSPSPHSHSQAGLLPATSDGGNRVEPGRGDDWPVSMSWGVFEKKLYKNFTKIHGGNEKNELFRVLGLSHGWALGTKSLERAGWKYWSPVSKSLNQKISRVGLSIKGYRTTTRRCTVYTKCG